MKKFDSDELNGKKQDMPKNDQTLLGYKIRIIDYFTNL